VLDGFDLEFWAPRLVILGLGAANTAAEDSGVRTSDDYDGSGGGGGVMTSALRRPPLTSARVAAEVRTWRWNWHCGSGGDIAWQ
jgi:hypothetical protein